MNDKTNILIASFLRIAREDLDGAHLLASRDNRNAVYLCEQAAEKIIRAVLTSEGIHAGIKHGLRQMVEEKVPGENPFKPALFEIAGRVPTPLVGQKLATLVDQVEVVLVDVAAHFKVDLTAKDGPASEVRPPR